MEAEMDRIAASARPWQLRGAGLALLGLAWISGHALVAIAAGHAGHEPPWAYLLALATFLPASAGTAFAVMGPRLFRKVIVADRWLPHVPATFRDQEKAEDEA
jgi:hypothetical protein